VPPRKRPRAHAARAGDGARSSTVAATGQGDAAQANRYLAAPGGSIDSIS